MRFNDEKIKFNIKEVGLIGNYYGGLNIMQHEGKYYWIIENHNTDFNNLEEWDEIEEELYNALIKHYDAINSASE